METEQSIDENKLERLSSKARRAHSMIIGSMLIFVVILLITLVGSYAKIKVGAVYHSYLQQYSAYFIVLWIAGIVIYFASINIGTIRQMRAIEEYTGKKYGDIPAIERRQILLKLRNYHKKS